VDSTCGEKETSTDGKQAGFSQNPKEPTAFIKAEVRPFVLSRPDFESPLLRLVTDHF